jgi:hypothetical protein
MRYRMPAYGVSTRYPLASRACGQIFCTVSMEAIHGLTRSVCVKSCSGDPAEWLAGGRRPSSLSGHTTGRSPVGSQFGADHATLRGSSGQDGGGTGSPLRSGSISSDFNDSRRTPRLNATSSAGPMYRATTRSIPVEAMAYSMTRRSPPSLVVAARPRRSPRASMRERRPSVSNGWPSMISPVRRARSTSSGRHADASRSIYSSTRLRLVSSTRLW